MTQHLALVVDDDEVDRMAVRRLGEGLGWRVQEASTLAQALAWFGGRDVHEAVDCVLLDFNLPDGDGFASLAAFATARVEAPVVMLTGLEDADVAVRLMTAGAADFLPKRMLSGERLEQVLTRATRVRRAERERLATEHLLLAQQGLLAAVVEQLPSALLITDRAGRILLRNAKAVELFGAELASASSITELAQRAEAPSSAASFGRAELVRALAAAEDTEEDFKLASPLGEIAVRLRRLDVVGDGDDGQAKPIARLALFSDVTELRATEAYQRQVMAIASHDLRNPLSAISMNAAILSRADPMTDDRRIRTAARITSSGNRMARMIEDLFDYTLAALGKGIPIRYRAVDLAVIAEEAVSEARAAHAGRQFSLRKEGDLHGVWDSDRLHQILQNLLGNAVQYGDATSPIGISCVEDVEAGTVEICVQNQGEPIPAELLPHVFEAYRRGAGAGRSGLGLGLYIARRVVEAHRGLISVASSEEAGTQFTVRLPKRQPEVVGDKAIITPPRGHGKVSKPQNPP